MSIAGRLSNIFDSCHERENNKPNEYNKWLIPHRTSTGHVDNKLLERQYL